MAERIFIALELPPVHCDVVQSLLADWSKAYPKGINWVKPGNLHLTVLFVGDVETPLLPQLCAEVEKASQEFFPFDLSLWGCELFPAKMPRLVWIKLKHQSETIFNLPKALARPIRQMGCDPDIKPLKLHITLGRIKWQPDNLDERQIIGTPIQSDFLPYSQLSVYKSILRPDGPTYHLIERFNLEQGVLNTGKQLK